MEELQGLNRGFKDSLSLLHYRKAIKGQLILKHKQAYHPPEAMGSQMEAMANQMEAMGNQTEAMSNQMEAMGNQTEAVVNQTEAMANQMEA